ncbi:S8 family peptidase [Bailinhaonella thermotolerans]|uniref:Serine protease n=1 Tax=Bailinhaonella thermotolerans TaxID=1070861 RepID=A0A3A4B0N8_9ACTN|nr:S8 family serine peptidase [Bailinhaonella thermotolerans]RJL33498.1 serine protease [Bailinhaonella thermotolerans]
MLRRLAPAAALAALLPALPALPAAPAVPASPAHAAGHPVRHAPAPPAAPAPSAAAVPAVPDRPARAAVPGPGARAVPDRPGPAVAGRIETGTRWRPGADEVRDAQRWVFSAINAAAAWRSSTGEGVTVAVLDSGVDPGVAELRGKVRSGPDLTSTHTSPDNPGWGLHGTGMASLIAGRGTGEDSGVLGVAPDARVLSVRVLVDEEDPEYWSFRGSGASDLSLGDGIRYAVDNGADVINMSLGAYEVRRRDREAINYALSRGVVLVAATGNDGDTKTSREEGRSYWSFPAGYPGVIGVGAVDRNGRRGEFSNDNLSVSVAAPGVGIAMVLSGGRYARAEGTSPAAALVSGVAALIKSRHPRMRPELVARAITSTARPHPREGYDDEVGFGVVDAGAALATADRLAGYRSAVPPPQERFGKGYDAGDPVSPGADPPRMWAYGGGLAASLLVFGGAIAVLLRRSRRRLEDHE